ncbi:MAG: oxidoreductase [Planctomycetaceae bacterium]|nr:oxidoreductase [Planctomycetaceae bacterium]
MALIGGGGNAFIGRVHAIAAQLDNRAELVAGALSSDPQRAQQAAPEFGIAPARAYSSAAKLITAESQLPEDERVDFVSIATPNHTHFEIARQALDAGFHVVCDKPMTISLDDAEELVKRVEETGRVFAVTHNYTGYPMIRQAREMIAAGELGRIIAARATYVQGWLWSLLPDVVPKRGVWKADPNKAGSGSLGDIGTHAYNLLRYATGLTPVDLSCLMQSYHPLRELDDYGHAAIRFENGASGLVTFSQVTHGRLNDLRIEIDGTKGSISWAQEQPNELFVRSLGQPLRVYERNPMAPYTNELGRAASRIPGGHPEAFFEAFANIYRAAFDDMISVANGATVNSRETIYPSVHDGREGVLFVQQCQASSANDAAWVQF